MSIQRSGLQRLVDDNMACHGSGPAPTTGHAERASTHAEAVQRVEPSMAIVPAQPEAFAHVSSDPAREGVDLAAPVDVADIVPPSAAAGHGSAKREAGSPASVWTRA
jgi:hypothetical protein